MRHLDSAGRSMVAVAMLALMALPSSAASAQDSQSSHTVSGTTFPSQRLQLSFQLPGIVREVAVQEGDRIEAGQLLLRADDRMERKQLQIMELEADSTLPLEAAEADLAAREVTLERVRRMRDTASRTELLEAELAVTIAELRVLMARQEIEQKKLQTDRQRIRVELMELTSPIDGVVEQIETGVGEAVDPSRPSCIVVTNDPLWIEINPHWRDVDVSHLKVGDVLEFTYDRNRANPEWHEARVIYIAPVADAASTTHRVRLEAPNPSQRASGMSVRVRVPEPTGVAATD